MRVLVVDDDATVRGIAAGLLRSEGHEADAAADAAQARAKIAEGAYDLVLLDLGLPDADGIQLLREWRAEGLACPVLALTGAESDAVVEAFLREGAHDVIPKARLDRRTLRRALASLHEPPAFDGHRIAPRAPRDDNDDAQAVTLVPQAGTALVVDDVPLARQLVRGLLERDGWRVDEASTAAEGLERALWSRPDLVLLDHLLPDVDGVGLLEEMRRRGVDAPVIALTAHGDERVATEFLMAGAVDLVAKETLTLARLREAIARAVMVPARARR